MKTKKMKVGARTPKKTVGKTAKKTMVKPRKKVQKLLVGRIYACGNLKAKVVGRTARTISYIVLDHNAKEVKSVRTFYKNFKECFAVDGSYPTTPVFKA